MYMYINRIKEEEIILIPVIKIMGTVIIIIINIIPFIIIFM